MSQARTEVSTLTALYKSSYDEAESDAYEDKIQK
jgi:hypothetical protein